MSSKTASIKYFGHSTVLIETEEKLRIMIDPFLDGNPICPLELQDPGPVDIICLSHGHSDHCGSVVTLAKKYGPKICATFELANLLLTDGVPESNIQFMNKGGGVQLSDSGLRVHLTNAYHSSSYDSSDGKTRYAGEAAGIVVELESGRSIYHAGDTCLFSDMSLIAERFSPTAALLPIGDRFTMGPEDAAKAAALIKAKTIIPIHHSTFPALTGTPAQFAELLSESPYEVAALAPGDSIEV